MKKILLLLLVTLLLSDSTAVALGTPNKLTQIFYEADGVNITESYYMFNWDSVPGATKYKIISKAYTPKTQKHVGDVVVAIVTDTFFKLTFTNYEKILHNYELTVDSQYLTECESGACLFGLQYESYLIAANDDEEGAEKVFDVVAAPVTGIENLTFDMVSIYPNPVENVLHISLSTNDLNSFVYRIYDIKGKQVLDGTTKKHRADINLSSLASGTYVINIVTKKGLQLIGKRIVKR